MIWRRAIRTLPIVLVVALAGLLATKLIGRSRLAKARVTFAQAYGSADPSAWATQDDLEQDNAARLLRAAGLALRIGPGDRKAFTHAGHPEEWTEAQRRDPAALIERNRLALALFRMAAGVSRSVYGDRCAADDSVFPSWWTRNASMLLAADAELSYERGDASAAVDSLRAITRLALVARGRGAHHQLRGRRGCRVGPRAAGRALGPRGREEQR